MTPISRGDENTIEVVCVDRTENKKLERRRKKLCKNRKLKLKMQNGYLWNQKKIKINQDLCVTETMEIVRSGEV